MTADGPKTSKDRTESAHRRGYLGVVRGFSIVFLAVGVAILVRTLTAGGGPLSVGVVMGVAFVAVGAGRLWVSSRVGR